jgi:hypothetical protein
VLEILCKRLGHKPVPYPLFGNAVITAWLSQEHSPTALREPVSTALLNRDNPLNISKHEQRVLPELAFGGAIHHERHDNGKIRNIMG